MRHNISSWFYALDATLATRILVRSQEPHTYGVRRSTIVFGFVPDGRCSAFIVLKSVPPNSILTLLRGELSTIGQPNSKLLFIGRGQNIDFMAVWAGGIRKN